MHKARNKIMNTEGLNLLSNKVIGIAIEVHKELKAGFSEKIYQEALEKELKARRIAFNREKSIKVKYKNEFIGNQRIDFLIEDELILEIKRAEKIGEIQIAQILSYLKTVDKRLGIILNFGEPKLGIKRVVNEF